MLNNTRLISLRKNNGLLQKDMALNFGIERATYTKYETGDIQPPNDMVVRLASFFDVSTDYLLGLTNIPNTPNKNAIRVPVLGHIPAGIPIEAVEDVLDFEEIPFDWSRGGKEFFALRLSGDSMSPDYVDGETVIFQAADTCESGDECAVMVNGEDATFKKVIRQSGGIVLQPLNTVNYEPVFYSDYDIENTPVRILGIVVESRRPRGRLGRRGL